MLVTVKKAWTLELNMHLNSGLLLRVWPSAGLPCLLGLHPAVTS